MCTQDLLKRLEAELTNIDVQIQDQTFINAGPQGLQIRETLIRF